MSPENSYAFDECSILKLCKIKIPESYRLFFKEDSLIPRNHYILNKIVAALDKKGISKYKFVPGNFEQNAVLHVNQILENKRYQIRILGESFRAQIIDQLEDFYDELHANFKDLEKINSITPIKEIFIQNEKELIKEKNIPEDDDMTIIAAYRDFSCESKKYLISEDEHFWGYKDIILNNFNIHIIRERECEAIL
ncbi:MAG: hypothetical protein KAS15_00560 [Nanoarchaeota archaeon]|nr:hypothetical protein [Nanoarchaeota archaeon]MCK5629517.1 hypothetical protein [Nanoarchaeota archaeon]